MTLHSCNALVSLFLCCGTLHAQEVRYIDLSHVSQQTELRHPPSLDCPEGGICGGYSGASVASGAPDWRDPRALAIYLLNVSPLDIDPEKPVEVEFKLLNTGSVPIEVPVSPDLSYLQPADESIPFTYSSVALVTRVKSEQQAPALSSVGYVQLYGAGDRKESILALKPGEWIRVRGKVKLWACPSGPVEASLQGEFWLRTNTFRPHPGGSSTEVINLYPNATSTPATAVHFLCPSK